MRGIAASFLRKYLKVNDRDQLTHKMVFKKNESPIFDIINLNRMVKYNVHLPHPFFSYFNIDSHEIEQGIVFCGVICHEFFFCFVFLNQKHIPSIFC